MPRHAMEIPLQRSTAAHPRVSTGSNEARLCKRPTKGRSEDSDDAGQLEIRKDGRAHHLPALEDRSAPVCNSPGHRTISLHIDTNIHHGPLALEWNGG